MISLQSTTLRPYCQILAFLTEGSFHVASLCPLIFCQITKVNWAQPIITFYPTIPFLSKLKVKTSDFFFSLILGHMSRPRPQK